MKHSTPVTTRLASLISFQMHSMELFNQLQKHTPSVNVFQYPHDVYVIPFGNTLQAEIPGWSPLEENDKVVTVKFYFDEAIIDSDFVINFILHTLKLLPNVRRSNGLGVLEVTGDPRIKYKLMAAIRTDADA